MPPQSEGGEFPHFGKGPVLSSDGPILSIKRQLTTEIILSMDNLGH